ncbi:reverse transcriptase [Clonorchis sinensis]|uniref:Reverse transcriptase n=1 Tax=Clonorchis sinensis TaxID=79923 RepID=G7Y891_CLOSI|nr:reverse transcriptase [Clonorchis sinensis]
MTNIYDSWIRANCTEVYVEQTARERHSRIGEHRRKINRPLRNADEYRALVKDSTIAEHVLDTGHKTDLENVEVLRRGLRFTSQRPMAEAVEISKPFSVNRIEGVELASICTSIRTCKKYPVKGRNNAEDRVQPYRNDGYALKQTKGQSPWTKLEPAISRDALILMETFQGPSDASEKLRYGKEASGQLNTFKSKSRNLLLLVYFKPAITLRRMTSRFSSKLPLSPIDLTFRFTWFLPCLHAVSTSVGCRESAMTALVDDGLVCRKSASTTSNDYMSRDLIIDHISSEHKFVCTVGESIQNGLKADVLDKIGPNHTAKRYFRLNEKHPSTSEPCYHLYPFPGPHPTPHTQTRFAKSTPIFHDLIKVLSEHRTPDRPTTTTKRTKMRKANNLCPKVAKDDIHLLFDVEYIDHHQGNRKQVLRQRRDFGLIRWAQPPSFRQLKSHATRLIHSSAYQVGFDGKLTRNSKNIINKKFSCVPENFGIGRRGYVLIPGLEGTAQSDEREKILGYNADYGTFHRSHRNAQSHATRTRRSLGTFMSNFLTLLKMAAEKLYEGHKVEIRCLRFPKVLDSVIHWFLIGCIKEFFDDGTSMVCSREVFPDSRSDKLAFIRTVRKEAKGTNVTDTDQSLLLALSVGTSRNGHEGAILEGGRCQQRYHFFPIHALVSGQTGNVHHSPIKPWQTMNRHAHHTTKPPQPKVPDVLATKIPLQPELVWAGVDEATIGTEKASVHLCIGDFHQTIYQIPAATLHNPNAVANNHPNYCSLFGVTVLFAGYESRRVSRYFPSQRDFIGQPEMTLCERNTDILLHSSAESRGTNTVIVWWRPVAS